MQEKLRSWKVSENDAGQRLDRYVRKACPGVPLSHIYKMFRTGDVRLNGKRGKQTARLAAGDRVEVRLAKGGGSTGTGGKAPYPPQTLSSVARKDLHILFEDEDLLVLDKPSGLLVHPGSGPKKETTLIDLARGYLAENQPDRPEELFEPSLVHRIDRETSGVVIVAKTGTALRDLTRQFKEGSVQKTYLTLVTGNVQPPHGEIEVPLVKRENARYGQRVKTVSPQEKGGKEALTFYRTEKRYGRYSLLNVQIVTGRTHQIRVHLSSAGWPILGDTRYGDFELNRDLRKKAGIRRLMLHSRRISFMHPSTGGSAEFAAPVPPDFQKVLERLQSLR